MSTENNRFGIARENYKIFVAGVALIVLGYLLMMGGGSEDPNVFNPEIFSFRRITLAPLVCLAGFATIMVAIMRRSKSVK
jgi:membrane-bound ClpP family serine protease